ncbi:MAG: nucleotide-binding protein [Minicystis sp.]
MRSTTRIDGRPIAGGVIAALLFSAACGGGGGETTNSGSSSSGSGGSGPGGAGGNGGQASSSSSGSTTSSSSGSGGAGGATVCSPGETASCYTGPFGTEDVGICHGGTKTCADDGSGFGACEGEVLPTDETCLTPEDDDCDGKVNEEGEGCVCIPGSVTTCYSGPAGTEGVGACIAGILTCLPDGTGYGPCMGEVTPMPEDCSTPIDEDCDGQTPLCPALWAKRFGDVAGQFAWGLAVDPTGGAVVTGDLDGTADFGGGALTTAGSSDVFLAKLDANGAHVWSKKFGNATLQSGQGVAVDAMGNVVITGYFQGSVTFGTTALTTAGGADIFVAKFNAAGAHVWSKKFGSATDDQLGLAVAVDPSGNVLLTGALVGAFAFGGATLTSAGGSDVFVAKLDGATGNHVWSKRFGDAGLAQQGRAIAADAMGNVIVAGDFNGTIDFGGGALTSAGGSDAFVAKLDAAAGNHVWSKRFGDGAFQIAHGVAADATGNVVVVGDFAGDVDFGGGAIPSKGNTDAFVALFDPAGAHLASAGFGGTDYDSATSVSAAGGVIAVGGYFAGKADFGGTPLTSAGGRDVFVTKLSGTTLAPVWARGFGDASFYQSAQGVGLDTAGNMLFAGYFFGSIDFGAGPLTSAGDADVFVAKLGP